MIDATKFVGRREELERMLTARVCPRCGALTRRRVCVNVRGFCGLDWNQPTLESARAALAKAGSK